VQLLAVGLVAEQPAERLAVRRRAALLVARQRAVSVVVLALASELVSVVV